MVVLSTACATSEPASRVASDQSKVIDCTAGCMPANRPCDGWAKVRFDISHSGKPVNIEVVEECPAGGEFGAAAATAVAEWSYRDDQANQDGAVVQLDFSPSE